MLLIIILLLSGCRSDLGSVNMDASQKENTVSTDPIPITSPKNACYKDNIYGVYPGISAYPASNGKGFYYSPLDTNRYDFYSIAEKTAFQMCSRAGCRHKDEHCLGYISDLECFLEANSNVYAFCQNDTSVWLLKIESLTGERTKLYTWEGLVGENYYMLDSCFYSGERIFITITMVDGLSTTFLQCFDLKNETLYPIAESGSSGSGNFLGAYGDYAFVDWYGLSEELPTIEKYLEEHPENNEFDYYSYINQFQKEHTKAQVRKYNLSTGKYEDVYSALQQGSAEAPSFWLTGSYSAFGKYLLYSLEGNKICRYDMETGEAQHLLTVENLFGATLADDRLLYWSRNSDALCIRLRDLDTGEELLIENEGNNKVHVFSIHGETATVFIGLYNSKKAWISKEDYYAQRYDRVVYYPG